MEMGYFHYIQTIKEFKFSSVAFLNKEIVWARSAELKM